MKPKTPTSLSKKKDDYSVLKSVIFTSALMIMIMFNSMMALLNYPSLFYFVNLFFLCVSDVIIFFVSLKYFGSDLSEEK